MSTTPTPVPVIDTVLKDIFVVGVTAASIFVKNPNHQAEASAIVNVLKDLLPSLF